MSDDEEDGMAKTTEDRFWEKVHGVVETRCLEWRASTFHEGYGAFWYEGRPHYAHRVAWFLEYGRWPEHTLDHLCRNVGCVSVDHLEDVPHAVNVARGDAGRYLSDRTECVNGHPYTPENTGRQRDNGKYCRTCKRESKRRSRARQKAQNGA